MNQIGILMNQIEAFGRWRLTLRRASLGSLTVVIVDRGRWLRPAGESSKNNIRRGQSGLPWHWL